MEWITEIISAGLGTIMPFVILLGLLIFIHELGHFLVARWCGVRVEVFSLGFGKKILQKKLGDTTYAISLIPLGGYVKMFGDEVGKDIPAGDQKVSFLHKTVGQRIAIVLAGPLMNLFFAAILFIILAWGGEIRRKPELGDIQPQSEAYQSGFRPGDVIFKVQNQDVQNVEEIQEIMNTLKGQRATFEVRRIGYDEPVAINTEIKEIDNPNPIAIETRIGHIPGLTFESVSPVIGVRFPSLAYQNGLRTGDQVLSIQGHEINHFRQIENKIMTLQGGNTLWKVKRGKDVLEITLPISIHEASLNSLGIEIPELFIGSVVKNSPAQQAGLQTGDRILAIQGQVVNRWEEVVKTISSIQNDEPIRMQIERESSGVLEISVQPKDTSLLTPDGKSERRKTIGITTALSLQAPAIVKKHYPLLAGVWRGIEKSYEISIMTILSFVRLIENKISPKTIGGVISIGQVAKQSFQMGWEYFVHIMGVISINLFILNLLPVPVLDGGHLLFFTLEAIRGTPLSMRKMEIAQQIGLVILLGLMSFALFNDFSRIFGF